MCVGHLGCERKDKACLVLSFGVVNFYDRYTRCFTRFRPLTSLSPIHPVTKNRRHLPDDVARHTSVVVATTAINSFITLTSYRTRSFITRRARERR